MSEPLTTPASGRGSDERAAADSAATLEPAPAGVDQIDEPDERSPSPPAPPPTEDSLDSLRPAEIVARLDTYIIGQAPAKRAIAIALRNRVRRRRLPDELRDEVIPKNILMIGPTGVGKTEIARRLARFTNSPFIKVEATKFTEVGYVGRDVEAIIRDLLEQTITEVHNDRIAEVEERARELAEHRILDSLIAAEGSGPGSDGDGADPLAAPGATPAPPDAASSGGGAVNGAAAADPTAGRRRRSLRRRLQRKLAARQLDERLVDVEVEEPYQPPMEALSGGPYEDVGASLADFLSQLAPPRRRVKRMTVADARHALTQEETDRLVDMDRVYDDAIGLVETAGIVFIDEMDKIVGHASEHGPDVSGEGVQRDLLPLLEGSTVHTRYGSVRTDHILFVGAGAFTASKPSELIPEMQGRFPIRVELAPLSESDLERILVEPDNALTTQYAALLGTEDVTLDFTRDGIRELAGQAAAVNAQDENIGARRLFTILETVLEDASFRAEEFAGQTVRIDAAYVRERLVNLVRNEDLRRYVL